MAAQEDPSNELTVVVIAGAVARGAYEAAAMTTILPKIVPDLRSTILLGTSAGAINAVLWAQLARTGRSLEDVGREVEDVWRRIDHTKVFALSPRDVVGSLVQGQSPHEILDTSPLEKTFKDLMRPEDIAANVERGDVAGVGVVATLCPQDGSGGRSRLFLCSKRPAPAPDPTASLDYFAAKLGPEHLLASSAVPILFPAAKVEEPAGAAGWYMDGGVRLNTPIKPAIDLGATRIVVISSYAAEYPPSVPARIPQPTLQDAAAQSLHALLGDAMIEDLRRLRRTNAVAAQAPITAPSGRPYRRIPFMVAAPANAQLSRIARDTFRPHLLDAYWFLKLVLPDGLGNNELLSYFYFERPYFEAQFDLAREQAAEALQKGWQE